MALELKVPTQVYKEFYGRNVDQMPLLIKEGRVPMSVSGLMKRRLEVENSKDKDLRNYYLNNYFGTGDGLARHPDGRVKIVLDAKQLKELNPESELLLLGGGLILTDGVYEALEGLEFNTKDLDKYTGRPLKKGEVKDNPIWLALARGDQHLLDEYTDMIFAKAKIQFNYNENMGLYLLSVQEKSIMRSWFVRGLDSGSDAGGYLTLGGAIGRLVGVAPEAQSGTKNLESKL